MKLILFVFHADKEEMLHKLLNTHLDTGFTTWGPVFGKGRRSEPRMGTQIWPGENQMLMIALSDHEAEILKETVQSLTETPHGGGIKVFELSAHQWL